MLRYFAIAIMLSPLVMGQGLDLKFLDYLASKTDESVTVTLDENLLRLGAAFLGGDSEAKDIKGVVNGLKSITVRSFKFDKEGEYTQADIDKVYAQLKGWSQIVDARDKKERSGVWLLQSSPKTYGGLAVVTHSPRELTVVSIVGNVNVDTIEKLSGNFGIPEMKDTKKPSTPAPKKDEEEED
jgi:hypothetical protein